MDSEGLPFSEETKRKVLEVIEKENYVPYFKFREKEGLKSRLIGLIIRKDHRERENIVLSAARTAEKQGYGMLVSYVEKDDMISGHIDEMLRRNVSGLIIDSREKLSCSRLENASVYLNQTKIIETPSKEC